MKVAASVTPYRHDAGSTVLDKRRKPNARGTAAGLGGDVVGTDQIPMPLESTAAAVESAAAGLGDPPVAAWAGGGRAALIHQPYHNPGQLGLVAERLHQMGAATPPQAEVLHPSRPLVGDPLGIANQQCTYPLSDGEGDHLLGGLVLGLPDAPPMPCLDLALPGSQPAPAARASLPRLWCSPGGLGLPGLLIRKVQVVLGA
jgi:hypothetical protein